MIPKNIIDPNIVNQEWDYIVIGTGMGGATIGHALAKAGKRVLFLEKGEDVTANPAVMKGNFLEGMTPAPEHGGEIAYRNAGRSHEKIWDVFKQRPLQPLLGSGTGGSSALYGMVMERFWPQDFEPRRYFPSIDPKSSLPQRWPITFDMMEPYYRRAESLYRVSCSIPDPLRKEQTFAYLPSPALPHKSARLANFLKHKGLHPYFSPLALDWVSGCRFCQSFLCDKGCKNDAQKICLEPARKEHGAVLVPCCEVTRLEADGRRVTQVVAQHEGERVVFTGKNIILALGALKTPLLLQRSTSEAYPRGLANSSGLVGRNLMRHYIDLLAIFSRSPFPKHFTLKESSFNDFYVFEGQKYGTVGSFGHMPPTYMILEDIEKELETTRSAFLPFFKATRAVIGWFLERFFAMAGYFTLIHEDLPYEDNRVYWDEGSHGTRIAVEYKIREAEAKRIGRFREMTIRALSPNPTMLLPQADNLKFLAHASGTCRFGDDPKTSVLNKYNRAHDLDNLYIVDASFFPSSGGTNPALTIAANALRVADHLLAQN